MLAPVHAEEIAPIGADVRLGNRLGSVNQSPACVTVTARADWQGLTCAAPCRYPARMSEPRRASPEEVRALSHPLRLRILALCHGEAMSNKELAGRLHEKPATVLHHVRTLVRTGFLEPEEPRPGPRGSTLRPYRATDKSWTIDVGGPTETQSTKRAALDAAFAETRAVPGPELGPLLLFTLRASRQRLEKLIDHLADELDTADAETSDTDEPIWNVLITSYPASR